MEKSFQRNIHSHRLNIKIVDQINCSGVSPSHSLPPNSTPMRG
ncbi:hypothetical protein CWATWH0401_2963 [Crocosphaera watsonii WH 0401]|uniref:Uncharacterized protein n=1 Tax=Crocosphaera watsonii WH 0401 TaxID=555881 RepID=T2J5E8_CROWT|nr:hypothetical protein CWATWH0401_2963 [Crocosphaera watsonii WH 0401]